MPNGSINVGVVHCTKMKAYLIKDERDILIILDNSLNIVSCMPGAWQKDGIWEVNVTS